MIYIDLHLCVLLYSCTAWDSNFCTAWFYQAFFHFGFQRLDRSKFRSTSKRRHDQRPIKPFRNKSKIFKKCFYGWPFEKCLNVSFECFQMFLKWLFSYYVYMIIFKQVSNKHWKTLKSTKTISKTNLKQFQNSFKWLSNNSKCSLW